MDSKITAIIDWFEENGLINDLHQFIQRSDSFARLVVGLSGWQWEDELAVECQARNLDWSAAPRKTLPYDGIVNSKKVQCKSACFDSSKKTMRLDIRRRHDRRYKSDDFDVLAVKMISPNSRHYYFIPSHYMLDNTKENELKCVVKLEDYDIFKDNWSILH